MLLTKICGKCKRELEATIENFYKQKDGALGFASTCKDCRKAQDRKHYQDNRETYLAQFRKYNKAHREEQAEYSRQYRLDHPNEVKNAKKQWYFENKEHCNRKSKENREGKIEHYRAFSRTYWKLHAETQHKKQKEYRAQNADYISIKQKEYWANNKDKLSQKNRLWREQNPDKDAEVRTRAYIKRRILEKGVTNTLTAKEWTAILNLFGNSCAYCGSKDSITRDHVVPLSKGGGMEEKNVIPACRKCNCSKHNKDIIEWYCQQSFFNHAMLDRILRHINGRACA